MLSILLLTVNLTFFQPNNNDFIIDGYTNHISCFPKDSVTLFLNGTTQVKNFDLKLYDIKGNEVAAFSADIFPQLTPELRPWESGFNYRVTRKIKIPDLKSGVYLFANKIPIVIKCRNPKITIVYPINTENAYCNSGGKSLYTFNSTDKEQSTVVSFLRPISISKYCQAFLKWMDKQRFEDAGYITDIDLDNYSTFKKSQLLIIIGHSEYWTLKARINFDRFINEGKNAMILSGNTMWWQVRYNKSKDKLICYRDLSKDPIKNNRLKTINWNDSVLNYSVVRSIGADFSYGGYGAASQKSWKGYKIVSDSPLLEHTRLKKNDILYLQTDEADGSPLWNLKSSVADSNIEALGFVRAEVIGFDKMSTRNGADRVETWIVVQRTATSGIVINTCSTNWCANNGIGMNPEIEQVTSNMIKKLLQNENVFSNDSSIKNGDAKPNSSF